MDGPVKQVIVIRKDLGMRRGKEIAQGSHASMAWLLKKLCPPVGAIGGYIGAMFTLPQINWLSGEFRKVVCQVQSEAELRALHEEAVYRGIESHLITDLGMTEFNNVPTVTALAIGPDLAEKIDPITSQLKLY